MGSREGLAFKITISLMLGLVLAIVGTIIFYMVRMMRREERQLKERDARLRQEAAAGAPKP